jgi:hypothetical protein
MLVIGEPTANLNGQIVAGGEKNLLFSLRMEQVNRVTTFNSTIAV